MNIVNFDSINSKIEDFYIINQDLMNIAGIRNQYGKQCSKVSELTRTFYVDKSPVKIIEDSLRSIGFNLKGAKDSAKWILGNIEMCPVMINHIHKICVFPDKSPSCDDTIWFNTQRLFRTSSCKKGTNIEFSNGHILWLPCKVSNFNNKWKHAEHLRDATVEIANDPMLFLHNPDRKNKLKKD